jgi:hypothetical protein
MATEMLVFCHITHGVVTQKTVILMFITLKISVLHSKSFLHFSFVHNLISHKHSVINSGKVPKLALVKLKYSIFGMNNNSR